MPRKSDKAEEVPAEAATFTSSSAVTSLSLEPAAVVVTQPEPVGRHHARFTVRTIAAASDSGLGYIVFDTQEERMVDAPFRDREDAVARAHKREIKG